jgi:hypothetical protein
VRLVTESCGAGDLGKRNTGGANEVGRPLHPPRQDVLIRAVPERQLELPEQAMSSICEGARELIISTEQRQANGVLVALRDSGRALIGNAVSAFSMLSTARSPAGSGWYCRFPDPSSTPTGSGGGQTPTSPEAPYFVSPCPVGMELMNSLHAGDQNGEPREHTALDASHQRACEGNKRPHRSESGPGRCHPGWPARGCRRLAAR